MFTELKQWKSYQDYATQCMSEITTKIYYKEILCPKCSALFTVVPDVIRCRCPSCSSDVICDTRR